MMDKSYRWNQSIESDTDGDGQLMARKKTDNTNQELLFVIC
jgi:hypothetical protein